MAEALKASNIVALISAVISFIGAIAVWTQVEISRQMIDRDFEANLHLYRLQACAVALPLLAQRIEQHYEFTIYSHTNPHNTSVEQLKRIESRFADISSWRDTRHIQESLSQLAMAFASDQGVEPIFYQFGVIEYAMDAYRDDFLEYIDKDAYRAVVPEPIVEMDSEEAAQAEAQSRSSAEIKTSEQEGVIEESEVEVIVEEEHNAAAMSSMYSDSPLSASPFAHYLQGKLDSLQEGILDPYDVSSILPIYIAEDLIPHPAEMDRLMENIISGLDILERKCKEEADRGSAREGERVSRRRSRQR